MTSYLRTITYAQHLRRRGNRILTKAAQRALPWRVRWKMATLLNAPEKVFQPISRLEFAPRGGYDVIAFSIIDWHFRYQRPQHLLTHFSGEGRRVFYISIRFHENGPGAFARQLHERIYEISLPGPRSTVVYQDEIEPSRLDELMAAIDGLRERADIRSAVGIVHLPFWTPLALAARDRWRWPVVYDCIDEHEGFSTNSRRMLSHESRLISESDLVVVTSARLHEKARSHGRHPLLIQNAADFRHFHAPSASPRVVSSGDGPVVGYFGAISEWFDDDLVAQAAAMRPAWRFVLIGDTFGARLAKLRKLRNVFLLGEQPYAELPRYLSQFDVACIPFLLTPLTASTSPVKFFEYLSGGKPVVATDLPELEPHKAYFYTARGADEFVAQTECALGETDPALASSRLAFARENTWDHRYGLLRDAVSSLLG
jgi:glycosyltransferase involved in cell wall biosynthesis